MPEALPVAEWADLDKLVKFDPNSFKANVTTELNKIKNRVVREQALNAMSQSMSDAESKAIEAGAEAGWSAFSGKLEGSFAKSKSEAKSKAKKAWTDALEKVGYSTEWTGEKFRPKSVDVYSKARLETAWGSSIELTYALTSSASGEDTIALTESAFSPTVPPKDALTIDQKLSDLETKINNINNRLCDIKSKSYRFELHKSDSGYAYYGTKMSTEEYKHASIAHWNTSCTGEWSSSVPYLRVDRQQSEWLIVYTPKVTSCNYLYMNVHYYSGCVKGGAISISHRNDNQLKATVGKW